ncbi:signal transduction histidine kinase [Deinococcus metalli]|uniref:histidine kinase n=1 Tax=Deinococcus metalli TaxID=1141878 RepID=A0A7W8KDS5_9DEIO|nr:HAMP domain-containing sensor histidine kinase [Deinococcus metalli]MBB5374669.1 signal transduction histidine kinase [Deinococcus metalli]GHF34579.1 two-component sensor histidine kinase [Deinococcus metalli]
MSARSVPLPTEAPTTAARRKRPATLRAQFTLVIFMLAFLPNVVLTFMAQPSVPAVSLIGWMVVVGGLCAAVGYLLSGTLLRSLSLLQSEVERGDFAQPHPDDPAEILSLRSAFGDLLGRLGVEQTRRNAFIATLVHDLKTPLIATGHLTKVLTTLPLPDAEKREVGVQIQAETTRLLALVQQMADAHRFEREDVQIHPDPTDLRALLDNVARRVQPQVTERGLSLLVTGHGEADVDARVLERAVINLTENALRYATREVVLSVTPRGVVVSDDGPGLSVPVSELAQPFNTQPTTIAGQQYTAGTAGLGLFIARRIAEAHGGGLHYDRAPPDTPPDPDRPPADAPLPVHTHFTLLLPEVTP